MNPHIGIAVPLAALIVFGILGESFAYRRYTGLKHWQSVLLGFFTAALAGIFCVSYHEELRRRIQLDRNFDDELLTIWASVVLPLLVFPFAVRLYHKLIGGQLSETEKLPGMAGVRAWLGVGNLICAALIPVCVWVLFGTSLTVLFALTFGLLLAYPVFNLVSATPQPTPVGPAEDLSNEREKVLQLLEAGKITAEESAELLNALGQSIPPRALPASEKELTPQRKIVLLGAALLLIGFFLPWFALNPGQMLNEATTQLQQMMGGMMPGNVLPQMNLSPNTGTVQVHAGDVAHGLGWWILALGIGAAVLPFFATNLKAPTQKKVILAALAIGGFLMIYLLSDALRYVSLGVILALAGYVLEFVGTLKERPSVR
jgi:hypothetical protein